jgi:hypothetical protein
MKRIHLYLASAILLFFFSAGTLFLSCRSAGEKAAEKAAEEAIEKSSGEKTDVDIEGDKVKIESENFKGEVNLSDNTWPKEIPGDVPEFPFGKIKQTVTSTSDEAKTWNVQYEEVGSGALDTYDAQLKKSGFKTTKITMGDKGSITAEKGKLGVYVVIGDGAANLSVQQRSE